MLEFEKNLARQIVNRAEGLAPIKDYEIGFYETGNHRTAAALISSDDSLGDLSLCVASGLGGRKLLLTRILTKIKPENGFDLEALTEYPPYIERVSGGLLEPYGDGFGLRSLVPEAAVDSLTLQKDATVAARSIMRAYKAHDALASVSLRQSAGMIVKCALSSTGVGHNLAEVFDHSQE